MKAANQRVFSALTSLNVNTVISYLDHETRTSSQAAATLGCSVSEIAKSIVFKTKSNSAVLAVTSGSNRVRLDRLSVIMGEKVGKADANFVRKKTGFSIGGVAPVGLPKNVKVVFDADLLQHDQVWAAAGTPNSLFPIQKQDLLKIAGERIHQFAEPLG